jgi:hypothetical protein
MSSPAGPHNLLSLDYVAEATTPREAGGRLGPPVVPIIDIHTHIHGTHAAPLYDRARRLFGITRTYTMTQIHLAQPVRDALGDSVRFITMPHFAADDKQDAHRAGYLRVIERFATEFDARMCKLWCSPALRDILPPGAGLGATDLADIDSPWRRQHARLATSLGMMFMVHVADPDTWFATRYRDGGLYGTKAHHYVGLRRMLDLFPVPWIAAHMGGWPEDLGFLDRLLDAHPNLHLDTSATKWIIRELSRHTRDEVVAFLWKHKGRILFGSDLVTLDDQLSPAKSGISRMADLASSPEQAFELYCSRYWALRTMFETDYDGPSPIADGDLKMIDPQRFTATSSPRLLGLSLPRELLIELYSGAATRLVEHWWNTPR